MPLAGLRPPGEVDDAPPPRALDRRRVDGPAQPAAAVRAAPSDGARWQMAAHPVRGRRDLRDATTHQIPSLHAAAGPRRPDRHELRNCLRRRAVQSLTTAATMLPPGGPWCELR